MHALFADSVFVPPGAVTDATLEAVVLIVAAVGTVVTLLSAIVLAVAARVRARRIDAAVARGACQVEGDVIVAGAVVGGGSDSERNGREPYALDLSAVRRGGIEWRVGAVPVRGFSLRLDDGSVVAVPPASRIVAVW